MVSHAITLLLSQNSTKGNITKGTNLSSIRNFWSQIASFAAIEVVTYLTSIWSQQYKIPLHFSN